VYIVNDSDGTEKQICALFGRITVETAVDPYLYLIQPKKRPNRFRKILPNLVQTFFLNIHFPFNFILTCILLLLLLSNNATTYQRSSIPRDIYLCENSHLILRITYFISSVIKHEVYYKISDGRKFQYQYLIGT